MPVVMSRLHSAQAVGLRVTPDFTADALGRKQGFDAGSNSLDLKAFDSVADDGVAWGATWRNNRGDAAEKTLVRLFARALDARARL